MYISYNELYPSHLIFTDIILNRFSLLKKAYFKKLFLKALPKPYSAYLIICCRRSVSMHNHYRLCMLTWSVPWRHWWEISHFLKQLLYKYKCQMLVLDFSNKFEKSQIVVELCFLPKLKWFYQDSFMNSATSHFRAQFWKWSCSCGQWELASHGH